MELSEIKTEVNECTPSYTPPEFLKQYANDNIVLINIEKFDIYSLGVTYLQAYLGLNLTYMKKILENNVKAPKSLEDFL